MATHSSILAWRIPWTEDLAGCSSHGGKELDTTEATDTHVRHMAQGIQPPFHFYVYNLSFNTVF